ncbi:MAG: adenylylsulfate reductase, subunit [Fusobacteriaceae bacterium]|jgi:adenylylsulfate reductase subunit B|nr:4Fe-4S ferredoxin iron-sulfur binding protein [Fusobacteriales bacterium]MDN5305128.1 adenylylsulfate reductase, subunit [Fusobacteriaceae bacterium]
MAIIVNHEKCIKCMKCTNICPGNLILFNGEKIDMYDKNACWDCSACIKECPVSAISMTLPTEIGGMGTKLTCKIDKNIINWKIYSETDKSKNENITIDLDYIMP